MEHSGFVMNRMDSWIEILELGSWYASSVFSCEKLKNSYLCTKCDETWFVSFLEECIDNKVGLIDIQIVTKYR